MIIKVLFQPTLFEQPLFRIKAFKHRELLSHTFTVDRWKEFAVHEQFKKKMKYGIFRKTISRLAAWR